MSKTETTERRCGDCGEPMRDIIEILEHGLNCDGALRAQDLTKSEQSTFLYIESRVVDNYGELDHEQMNHEDQNNIKLFKAADVIEVEEFQVERFGDEAWDLARDLRQMRADRCVDFDVGTPVTEDGDTDE